MPDPIVLRLSRPFRSTNEFLEAEADWITHNTMLLVDTDELPVATVVRFGVQLANGEWPIKAEACVTGYQRNSASGPSGVMVRFRRYGAATKRVVDQAAEIRARRESSAAQQTEHVATPSTATTTIETSSVVASESEPTARESGVHARVVRPVGAPVNREELLARLRQRAVQARREDSAPAAADAKGRRPRRATA